MVGMTKPPANARYLLDRAHDLEHDAQLRVIRSKSSGDWIKLEAALDDIERASNLRRYAERLDHPPGPYEGGGFWRDMIAAHNADPLARQRLGEQTRRAQEMTGVELRADQGHVPPGLEQRAVGTSGLAGLIPKGFTVGAAGGLPRTNRPLLDAVLADGGAADLPRYGTSMTVVASATQSMTASSTSAENVTVPQTDIIGVDSLQAVQPVVASITVSRQVADRADADAFINEELAKAVDDEQERLFVQGILSSTVSFVSCATATQVVVGKSVLQAARVGSDIRGTPTRIVAWHPRRHLWMSSQRTDTQQLDDVFANLYQAGTFMPVQSGALLASTIGSQDKVITMNGRDVRYAEEPSIRAYIDPSSGAGPLQVRIFGYRYMSQHFLYPSQIGCVTGAGLSAPVAFS